MAHTILPFFQGAERQAPSVSPGFPRWDIVTIDTFSHSHSTSQETIAYFKDYTDSAKLLTYLSLWRFIYPTIFANHGLGRK